MTTELNCEVYYKEGGFYRGIEKQWQVDRYGFHPRALFDLIYVTMRKIIDEDDHSEWAYEALEKCADLLVNGIRYPDEYRPANMAKNRIDEAVSKVMYKLGITKYQKYGPNCKLTRDPYIYFYAACVMLDRKQFISAVKIPWYLYRPNTWRWRKYLITGEGYKKHFVILLDYYRVLATKQIKDNQRTMR